MIYFASFVFLTGWQNFSLAQLVPYAVRPCFFYEAEISLLGATLPFPLASQIC